MSFFLFKVSSIGEVWRACKSWRRVSSKFHHIADHWSFAGTGVHAARPTKDTRFPRLSCSSWGSRHWGRGHPSPLWRCHRKCASSVPCRSRFLSRTDILALSFGLSRRWWQSLAQATLSKRHECLQVNMNCPFQAWWRWAREVLWSRTCQGTRGPAWNIRARCWTEAHVERRRFHASPTRASTSRPRVFPSRYWSTFPSFRLLLAKFDPCRKPNFRCSTADRWCETLLARCHESSKSSLFLEERTRCPSCSPSTDRKPCKASAEWISAHRSWCLCGDYAALVAVLFVVYVQGFCDFKAEKIEIEISFVCVTFFRGFSTCTPIS